MRLFHVGPIWSLPAVVGLDGERVVFLKLTVQFLFGANDSLASGLIHDHCVKGDILPVNFKSTNLTCKAQRCVFVQGDQRGVEEHGAVALGD